MRFPRGKERLFPFPFLQVLGLAAGKQGHLRHGIPPGHPPINCQQISETQLWVLFFILRHLLLKPGKVCFHIIPLVSVHINAFFHPRVTIANENKPALNSSLVYDDSVSAP